MEKELYYEVSHYVVESVDKDDKMSYRQGFYNEEEAYETYRKLREQGYRVALNKVLHYVEESEDEK